MALGITITVVPLPWMTHAKRVSSRNLLHADSASTARPHGAGATLRAIPAREAPGTAHQPPCHISNTPANFLPTLKPREALHALRAPARGNNTTPSPPRFVMGGASKGRVAKKQRPAKSSARSSDPSSPVRLMRRGVTRFSRSRGATTNTTNNGVDIPAIEQLYARFRDAKEDKIGPEGMQALFDTLNVDPLDITSLIFAWKLGAKVPFEFSRYEFVNGCAGLGADSLEKLQAIIPCLKDFLSRPAEFRNFYMYAFDYNKPPENRSLPIETARQLWPLILEGRFHHLNLWMEFLKDRKLAISRDTYSLLLDFANTIDNGMSNFDEENGAWPVMLDEFVEFAKPKLGAEMHE